MGQTKLPLATCYCSTSCKGAVFQSGERGIRTLGTLTGTPVFKTGAFNRSAISPSGRESRCPSREQQGIACVSRALVVSQFENEAPTDDEEARCAAVLDMIDAKQYEGRRWTAFRHSERDIILAVSSLEEMVKKATGLDVELGVTLTNFADDHPGPEDCHAVIWAGLRKPCESPPEMTPMNRGP